MSACKCGSQVSEVTDTRKLDDGTIRRRRTCSHCGHKFSTLEMQSEKVEVWEKNLDTISRLKALLFGA